MTGLISRQRTSCADHRRFFRGSKWLRVRRRGAVAWFELGEKERAGLKSAHNDIFTAVVAICARPFNRETRLMSDTRQLPESYIQTFREAVQAVDHMRQGGPETPIAHEGRPVRIGYIIEIASQYRDCMPDDLYAQLCEVAVSGGEAPDGDTFADGAKCLRSLYNDIMKQRRTKAEAQAGRWMPLRPHSPEP